MEIIFFLILVVILVAGIMENPSGFFGTLGLSLLILAVVIAIIYYVDAKKMDLKQKIASYKTHINNKTVELNGKRVSFNVNKARSINGVKHVIPEIRNAIDTIQKEQSLYDKKYISEFQDIEAENEKIISKGDMCSDKKEEYRYYKTQIDIIEKNIERQKQIVQMIGFPKIEIQDGSRNNIEALREAFRVLFSSKTIDKEPGSPDLRSFIIPSYTNVNVNDSFFEFQSPPAVLVFPNYYLYLMTNIILVFGGEGEKIRTFIQAVSPGELRYSLELRCHEDEVLVNGSDTYPQHTNSDSHKEGPLRTGSYWMHQCRDGSPDLRYNYNPLIEYSVYNYYYGVLKLSFGEETFQYNFSSYEAYQKLKAALKNYCNNKNAARQDHIPRLLNLIEEVSDDKEASARLSSNYSRKTANKYCTIKWDEKADKHREAREQLFYAKDVISCMQAAQKFKELGDYRDSKEKFAECNDKAMKIYTEATKDNVPS